MSTHYLIDLFEPDVTFANSEINAVRDPANGQTNLGGNFVVRVPSDVSVQNPTSLTDLLTKKYAGILANHAGFPRIAYDDMLDDAGINKLASGTNGTFGNRGVVSIGPTGGKVTSNVVTLLATPVQAMMVWEVYDYAYTDPATGLTSRTYREQTSSSLTCEISFNGGATFKPAVDGGLLNIPLGDRGTSFIVRFTNPGANRLWLGSWAVLY